MGPAPLSRPPPPVRVRGARGAGRAGGLWPQRRQVSAAARALPTASGRAARLPAAAGTRAPPGSGGCRPLSSVSQMTDEGAEGGRGCSAAPQPGGRGPPPGAPAAASAKGKEERMAAPGGYRRRSERRGPVTSRRAGAAGGAYRARAPPRPRPSATRPPPVTRETGTSERQQRGASLGPATRDEDCTGARPLPGSSRRAPDAFLEGKATPARPAQPGLAPQPPAPVSAHPSRSSPARPPHLLQLAGRSSSQAQGSSFFCLRS